MVDNVQEHEEKLREIGVEPRMLQWKWRHAPPPYPKNGTQEKQVAWRKEAIRAIIDALIYEGIEAWDGDGTACVQEIIQAVAETSFNEGVEASAMTLKQCDVRNEVAEYELYDGSYTHIPSPSESLLLEDFGNGLVSLIQENIRKIKR